MMRDLYDSILCVSGCGNLMYPVGEADGDLGLFNVYECEACGCRHRLAAAQVPLKTN